MEGFLPHHIAGPQVDCMCDAVPPRADPDLNRARVRPKTLIKPCVSKLPAKGSAIGRAKHVQATQLGRAGAPLIRFMKFLKIRHQACLDPLATNSQINNNSYITNNELIIGCILLANNLLDLLGYKGATCQHLILN